MRVGASEQHFTVGCMSVLVLWQKQLGLCAACAFRAHVAHVPAGAALLPAACSGVHC